jgi:hypothetical protein
MKIYNASGWDSLPSILDDARTEVELYERLDKLGFAQYQELLYRAGMARLYTRQITKTASSPAFSFCCVLALGGFVYTVGLKTLEDVLQFLREIDAQPIHPKAVQSIKFTNIDKLIDKLTDLADRLEKPTVTLKSTSGLKTSLDRLTNMLGTLVRNGAALYSGTIQIDQNTVLPINQTASDATASSNGSSA